jgi:putative flippase GtrA
MTSRAQTPPSAAAPAPAEPAVPGAAPPLLAEGVSRARWGARSAAWHRLLELARFGSVGALAYVVDLGVFNLIRLSDSLGHKPLTAKVVSVAVATLVAWLGNRYWTFAARRRQERGRELVGFLVVNVGGMLVAVACLAVSHYVLGFTSPLADNVAANGVGLVLGTAFRYVAYRRWVFTG